MALDGVIFGGAYCALVVTSACATDSIGTTSSHEVNDDTSSSAPVGGQPAMSSGVGGASSNIDNAAGESGSSPGEIDAGVGAFRFGAVGTRCDTDGDCAVDLYCEREFLGGRPICTGSCGASCPDGAICTFNVRLSNGGISGFVCLRPCDTNIDCEPLGSECDAPEESGESRYCF
jgi:hypothetical protein